MCRDGVIGNIIDYESIVVSSSLTCGSNIKSTTEFLVWLLKDWV